LEGRQSWKGIAVDVHAAMLGPRSARLGWPQKKPQSGLTNAARFGGYVMVHRTDIAGSVGCSIGQVKPGHDRIRGHAPNGALRLKHHLPRSSVDCCFGGEAHRHLLMKRSPSVHPIDAAKLCPIRFGPTDPWPDEAWTL
jgi:hypothetical protein